MVEGVFPGVDYRLDLKLVLLVLAWGLSLLRNDTLFETVLGRKEMGDSKIKAVFAISIILCLASEVLRHFVNLHVEHMSITDYVFTTTMHFAVPMIYTVNFRGILKRKIMAVVMLSCMKIFFSIVSVVILNLSVRYYSVDMIFWETFSSFYSSYITLILVLIFKRRRRRFNHDRDKKYNLI